MDLNRITDIKGMNFLFKVNNLYLGGQPSEDSLDGLKDLGINGDFKRVIEHTNGAGEVTTVETCPHFLSEFTPAHPAVDESSCNCGGDTPMTFTPDAAMQAAPVTAAGDKLTVNKPGWVRVTSQYAGNQLFPDQNRRHLNHQ